MWCSLGDEHISCKWIGLCWFGRQQVNRGLGYVRMVIKLSVPGESGGCVAGGLGIII
jgi:hypothetical protein